MELDESYWSERYLQGNTGWDIGYASPAIIRYFEGIEQKNVKILIPGGGNGYEAAALYLRGFEQVTLLDLAIPPLANFKEEHTEFPEDQLVHQDFFSHEGQYDYIIEQTFFCALPPEKRKSYVEKMKSLLKPGGKLVGLLFQAPLNTDQPPFGGNKEEYIQLFSPYFEIQSMEITKHSIAPRMEKELFIELKAN